MAVGNIGLQFGVNSVPLKKLFDMRIHVKENLDYLRYSTSFETTNTGVSFIEADPISIDKNLIIKDQTFTIAENSPRIFSEQVFTTQSFNLAYGKFLITDIVKTTSLDEQVPLYYWHDLSSYDSISNVEILDGEFVPVNADDYLYADETAVIGDGRKGVYTNITPEYNREENYYTIYYIKFRDLTTGAFITELLNPKEFYEPVGFDVTSKIRAYGISEGLGGTADIQVYFDSKSYSPTSLTNSQRFYVKITGENRVNIVKPIDLPASERWYLRVNPGEFYKSVVGGAAKYSVPEYNNQTFSPVPPYKLLIEKEAKTFTDKLIYLSPYPIANVGIDGFYIYIILKDNMGRVKRALTNDPDAGVYITPEGVTTTIFYEKGTIQSVAEESGFIRLDTSIDVGLNAFVTYRYIEKYFTYKGVSVNSTINPQALDKRIVMYIIPGTSESQSRSIYHLLVNENDDVIDTNHSTNFLTVDGAATDGGFYTLNDPELSSSNDYIGYELEVLSGDNAGRSLKIIDKDVINSSATLGDVEIVALNYGTKYDDYTIGYLAGGLQGSEIVSVGFSKIEIIIEAGVTTADDVVQAISLSLDTQDLIATTTNPTAVQAVLPAVNFNAADIYLTVNEMYQQSIASGDRYRIHKKFSDYSKFDPISSTSIDYEGWETVYADTPNNYIILADVYAVKTIVPSSVKMSDIRIRGGGVKEEYRDRALELQDEAQWFWDVGYWDGQPYPGMGALLVQLPRYILKEVGGSFTREQVEEIVRRHMAEGTYPIIRYYDKTTRIIDVEPSDSQIYIAWENVAASSYNIYLGNNPDNLQLHKTAAGVETEMTIVGLENNKIYYIKIEAVIGGIATLPSRTVFAIPFNSSSTKPGAIYGETTYSEGTYSL